MLGYAFEVRKAASSVGLAGERPDDGPSNRRILISEGMLRKSEICDLVIQKNVANCPNAPKGIG